MITLDELRDALHEHGIAVSLSDTIRARDVAQLLGVCVRTLQRWRHEHVLRAVRVGRQWRYSLADLVVFVRSRAPEISTTPQRCVQSPARSVPCINRRRLAS